MKRFSGKVTFLPPNLTKNYIPPTQEGGGTSVKYIYTLVTSTSDNFSIRNSAELKAREASSRRMSHARGTKSKPLAQEQRVVRQSEVRSSLLIIMPAVWRLKKKSFGQKNQIDKRQCAGSGSDPTKITRKTQFLVNKSVFFK